MGRRVFVAVNKTEGMNPDLAAAEFHELGLGAPRAISAEHGQGVRDLVDAALADFPVEEEPDGESDKAARIAVVGRPNAGKSTLVNALVGEERVVTFDEPGTTRDAIDVELAIGGRRYILVDTAGLRRRGKVFESVEKFSVVKTLQAIDRANVAVLVLDAQGQIRARHDQARHRAQAQVSVVRALSLHLGARGPRRCATDRIGGPGLPGGDGEAAHPETHPRLDRRRREAGASARRDFAAQAPLRASGRQQPPDRRRPRDGAERRARQLPALS